MSSTYPSGPPASEQPTAEALRRAVTRWADTVRSREPSLIRVGYLGSFSPDGSEEETHLDVLLVVRETDVAPADRVAMWDLSDIPVPTQPLVYTSSEWTAMVEQGGWLARRIESEAVWVLER